MSSLNNEITWDNITSVFRFVLSQWRKGLHTCLPGIVETYDAATRRAKVRFALRQVRTDGKEVEKAPLVNVPVVFPSGGGFTFTFPLAEGDPVWLMFSERGLSAFKKTFELATPAMGRFHDQSDAVAIPGFGALQITPADTDASAWQTEDGSKSVRLRDDGVEIHAGNTEVLVREDGNVTINVASADKVHLGGESGDELATKTFVRDQFNRHIHQTPMGPTAIPTILSPLTPGSDVTKKTKGE
ncbi:MAG: Gp138 family membrane-puncturing spike protein [Gemmatimonadetes bacterium]|nr:Gp138 family membrane-puncturing spike protein [Gemmatimonadota bacterium]